VTAQRYQRRANEVDAMRVTEATAVQVADWAGGYVDRESQTGKLLIRLPQTTIPACIGDWVVRDVMPDGLGPARAMRDTLFDWAFQLKDGDRYRRRGEPT
jgi:hypothetical protein